MSTATSLRSPTDSPSLLFALEHLLRRIPEPETVLDQARAPAQLVPAYALIAGFGLFAWALAFAGLHALSPQAWLAQAPLAQAGLPTHFLSTWSAALLAFFGAQLAGLPTFYFHAILARIPLSPPRLIAESLRAQATAALVLAGLVPLWFTASYGIQLIDPTEAQAPALYRLCAIFLGKGLPFVAGLSATYTLFRAFLHLSPREQGRPRGLPLALVAGWSLTFTLMAPLGFSAALRWFVSMWGA
jgi:hypothetical protein